MTKVCAFFLKKKGTQAEKFCKILLLIVTMIAAANRISIFPKIYVSTTQVKFYTDDKSYLLYIISLYTTEFNSDLLNCNVYEKCVLTLFAVYPEICF